MGLIVDILSIVGQAVSATATQFWSRSVKVAMDIS